MPPSAFAYLSISSSCSPSLPSPLCPANEINVDLRKAEAELAATLASLDPTVKERLGDLVKPDDLDPFEVRALGQFSADDALNILDR